MTPRARIDLVALHAALDEARRSRGLSWRQLAGEVGCSPSTMTRLAKGGGPDTGLFMALTRWLEMPAEGFWLGEDEDEATRPDCRLREIRAEAGLTQVQVAQRMGVSQQVVSRMERHPIDVISLRTLERYLHACGWQIRITRTPPA